MDKNNLQTNLTDTAAGDCRLIDSLLNGNQDVFSQLVLKYKDLIFNLCCRLLENPADAEDCAQETFIKAYYGLKSFKFKSGFKTWLYRIAINTCKNKLASKEYRLRGNMLEIDKPVQTAADILAMEIADPADSPETIVIKKETIGKIIKAIGSLPPLEKLLIVLCDLEGASYDEIAAISGLKLGTVKSKLARARHDLRGKLEGTVEMRRHQF